MNRNDKLYIIMVLACRQACQELGILKAEAGEKVFIKQIEFAFGQYEGANENQLMEILESRDRIIKETPEFA